MLWLRPALLQFSSQEIAKKHDSVAAKMNSYSFSLAERLIPATYLQQAASAKKSRENLIRQLIEQVN